MGTLHDEIRNHRYQTTDEVAEAHGDGRLPGGSGIGFLELEFKVHHELHPALFTLGGGDTQLVDDAPGAVARDTVLFEHLINLLPLALGAVIDLPTFALVLGLPVLPLGSGGEVGAQAHGDHAGEELGQTADDDELGAPQGREAGGQRKGHGETIRKANGDVADQVIVVIGVALGMGAGIMLVVVVGLRTIFHTRPFECIRTQHWRTRTRASLDGGFDRAIAGVVVVIGEQRCYFSWAGHVGRREWEVKKPEVTFRFKYVKTL